MTGTVSGDIVVRAEAHAALGEPVRLAIVEELVRSDRTASELGTRFGLPSNLLAHHLGVLERVGLIDRVVSSGDRRRRYVRVRRDRLGLLGVGAATGVPEGRVVFVCTHNSARSQLAAALWKARTGHDATSAGTAPAARVHSGAVAAARRAGLDLTDASPRGLTEDDLGADLVVTVCDRAHEDLPASLDRLHWSVPDPAEDGSRRAFDAALHALDERISAVA